MNSWSIVWQRLWRLWSGKVGLCVLFFFLCLAIYAPLLASSKPIAVLYRGEWYFPLFRYLFFNGFYTKKLDVFFNLSLPIFPFFLLSAWFWRHSARKWVLSWSALFLIQSALFGYLLFFPLKDPASDFQLIAQRKEALERVKMGERVEPAPLEWAFDLKYMNDYARLNVLLRDHQRHFEHDNLKVGQGAIGKTLWQVEQTNFAHLTALYKGQMANASPGSEAYKEAAAHLQWMLDRRHWLDEENLKITTLIMPLIRPYHWEEEANGELKLNRYANWWEYTRMNRKDLMAGLLFGIRISWVVGVIAVVLALAIGIPVGAAAGYYGGKFDMITSRFIEIWEAMPTFLMLLMVVSILQSKSIFLVIAVIGIFGWTSFTRYIRGEFLKQRNLPYVEACHCLGFSDSRIIFRHILPNALPPLLTLLPFAMMSAISSEAALSFLGLGEEGSCSWGILMDEGRSAFPGEAYLLWPPAFLLTLLLVATALVGDALRDALDPKTR